MLAIIQILLSIIMTVLYSISINVSFDLLGILSVLLIFIVSNLLVILGLFIIFVIFIYSTEKITPKSLWKHWVVHHYNVYMFRFFYRVRLIVTGKENLPKNMNFVVFSNHIEYTDPLYIMQAYKRFPIGFVAKDPLFKYPVLKNLMIGAGCIPITRFADRSALESIIKSIKQVKDGQPMGIFPEGKRTYCNDLIEFKPGAFKLPQKAKADISPVCLFNMHDLSKKWRIWPTKVYMHILPIVPYEKTKDLDSVQLSKLIFDVINEQMNQFKNNKE